MAGFAPATAEAPVIPTSSTPTASPIIDLDRANGDVLRIQARSYRDHTFVDVRVHYRAENGELRPTKKGVTIPPGQIATVLNAITRVSAEMEGEE